ncbi:Cytoplasmic tRNA 2-thiolation protein 1 [Erysiphe neolycopersici]|uniref:Cytoplasmic tRNA 2-thiolation protein 1 n=1 Tax=Erysiphe neolycopersici TaxID=212602 RepID=A0A420HDZ5_9PEZI|nr:Cytoplasmic tRNA 2-thiolation protein 1 [Erysiphe neolycopersici]
MAPVKCEKCESARALVVRSKNHQKLCRNCFIFIFEEEIHQTIITAKLFSPGDRVAIGASGGKDSTVVASVLKTLNERYHYGLDLVLLSIDEGIKGYRDDSLETVKRNAIQYEMPLKIVGYDELYGWTMDQVVDVIGKKGNCTYCGVFRRQALDRGAILLGINHVVTGHNADDLAETIIMNLFRGDLPRLARSTNIITGDKSSEVRRSKPLKYAYEKEIVLYAHHKKLDYFTTECIYSPEAFRGSARSLIKNLERVRPSAILDIIRSGEDMSEIISEELSSNPLCQSQNFPQATDSIDEENVGGCGGLNGRTTDGEMVEMEKKLRESEALSSKEIEVVSIPSSVNRQSKVAEESKSELLSSKKIPKKHFRQVLGTCSKCGYMSSQGICKACNLLEGLNKNRPKMEVQNDIEDLASQSIKKISSSLVLAPG